MLFHKQKYDGEWMVTFRAWKCGPGGEWEIQGYRISHPDPTQNGVLVLTQLHSNSLTKDISFNIQVFWLFGGLYQKAWVMGLSDGHQGNLI